MTEATSKQSMEDDGGRRTIAFEDAALLDRCRQGQTEAFGGLVEKYQDRVFNAILRFCTNRHDAEELCQEAFVKAFENLPRFRRASGFYTWLFRIAVNLTISHRRRGGRVRFHSLDRTWGGDEESRPMGDLLPDHRHGRPDDAAQADDANERVMKALAELDDEFRVVVVLRDIEDMNYGQISKVLDVPVGTVKSRLYRARCVLKDKLRDLMS